MCKATLQEDSKECRVVFITDRVCAAGKSKLTKDEDKMTNREKAIMMEAFMIGRIYATNGEQESPAEIQEKLERKCKIFADAQQRPENRLHKTIVIGWIEIEGNKEYFEKHVTDETILKSHVIQYVSVK